MRHIGLKRGMVSVVPYDNSWPNIFEEEKDRLLESLGDLVFQIEHIGSTAVPDLAAKPLIDMMAAVRSLEDYAEAVRPLELLGYEFMPERIFADRVFFPKGPRENRMFHLSLVEKDSKQWVDALLFREYLRTHVDKRNEYQALKQRLARQYQNNRERYTESKDKFICSVLELAWRELYSA